MLLEGDSRDYDKLFSEREYSSDSEKTSLLDLSDAKYDLENAGRESKSTVKQSGKRGAYYGHINHLYRIPNLSHPTIQNFYIKRQSPRKHLLDYLKEEARKEVSRLNSNIYERKSFSPVFETVKEEPIIYEESDSLEIVNDRSYNKKRKIKRIKERTPRPSPKKSSFVPPDNLSNLSDNPNIESFADFSDSMFKLEVRNKLKMFVCPEEGCGTELPSLSRIKRHYLIHTNLKPFECLNPNCSKRFSRKDNMIQHYRTHCNNR